LDLDLHVILTFFDKKLGPTPYLVYPRPDLNIDLDIFSKLMFQEEEGFFIYKNPVICTANYYFELYSPLARGEKELMMISFICNPAVQNPEKFQLLLEQFVSKLKQNQDFFFAFHKEEISVRKYKLSYDALKEIVHSLYLKGLESALQRREIFPKSI
jgi:hypothetical protein